MKNSLLASMFLHFDSLRCFALFFLFFPVFPFLSLYFP